jgi:hypothetical protein
MAGRVGRGKATSLGRVQTSGAGVVHGERMTDPQQVDVEGFGSQCEEARGILARRRVVLPLQAGRGGNTQTIRVGGVGGQASAGKSEGGVGLAGEELEVSAQAQPGRVPRGLGEQIRGLAPREREVVVMDRKADRDRAHRRVLGSEGPREVEIGARLGHLALIELGGGEQGLRGRAVLLVVLHHRAAELDHGLGKAAKIVKMLAALQVPVHGFAIFR